jgi:DNA invertase Pin-like site-specific DNA recombinase
MRTAGVVQFEAFLLNIAKSPVYQRIAPDVERLHRLGFSYSRIARGLGVSDKTVAEALRWRANSVRRA